MESRAGDSSPVNDPPRALVAGVSVDAASFTRFHTHSDGTGA
jgi:hypothetical protein